VDTMSDTRTAVAFRCDKDTLAEGLTTAFRASPQKAMIAALSGVLLEAGDDGRLVMSATDGELTIRTSVQADVTEPGEVVLHRLFGDIVRSLAVGAVDIRVDDTGVADISSARSHFSLRTYPRSDFPALPLVSGDPVLVEAGQLPAAIDQVVTAASTDRSRPILMGVLIEAVDTGLRLVATDSYRLAVRELGISGLLQPGEKALVPARGLAELSRAAAAAEAQDPVAVTLGEQRASFAVGRTLITTSLIEETFPNYGQLIPEQYPNRLEVARDELLDALRRVGLLAKDSTPVRLTLGGDVVRLRAIDPNLGGEADEEIDATYSGEPMTIAFNPQYLREAADSCVTEMIHMETLEPLKPAMITEPGSRAYLHLLMPVRVG